MIDNRPITDHDRAAHAIGLLEALLAEIRTMRPQGDPRDAAPPLSLGWRHCADMPAQAPARDK